MRDLASWRSHLSGELSDALIQVGYVAPGEVKEARRLARLMAEIELGLTLLYQVAPGEPASAVAGLLSGWRFPVPALVDDANWALVRRARFYLINRKGHQWIPALKRYLHIPQNLRLFVLNDVAEPPQLRPCSVAPDRLQDTYLKALAVTPSHQKRNLVSAKPGRWFCSVQRESQAPVEVALHIPSFAADVTLTQGGAQFLKTRGDKPPGIKVSWDDILAAAEDMDALLVRAGHEPSYAQRVRRTRWHIVDLGVGDYRPGTSFSLEGLLHVVGLLNAGKSTLLEVLAFMVARMGRRCALVLNDVSSVVRVASLFRFTLGIDAAPILGSSGRLEQYRKVYETLLAEYGAGVHQGASHPALRWFSQECRLLALTESEERWRYGEEPCHSLFQKTIGGGDDTDRDLRPSTSEHTCPFFHFCPRHQLDRDVASSLVWVLTSASLIHTKVPPTWTVSDGAEGEYEPFPTMYYAEAVYRECDVLLVDEADRVQVQFDDAFAPAETLVDNTGVSVLNRIGQQVRSIYSSGRADMAKDRFAAWAAAEKIAQEATDRFYQLILTHASLSDWVGRMPFTARSVFGRIVADLARGPEDDLPELASTRAARHAEREARVVNRTTSEEDRQRRKRLMDSLEGYIERPTALYRGHSLALVANELLYNENDEEARAVLESWCEGWVSENQEAIMRDLTDSTVWQEFVRNMHLAILLAVLDNRLVYLINHLADAETVLALADVGQGMVHRPPLDYLAVVPEAPVGNIIGFQYSPDTGSGNQRQSTAGGRLQYFRYVGVGRALLLRFPWLFESDGLAGPHTLLISGTSWAPGSPAYHVAVRPELLLELVGDDGLTGDAGIRESRFEFKWSPHPDSGHPITVSGLTTPKRRKAVYELLSALCEKRGRAPSFLESVRAGIEGRGVRDNRWRDRNRVLFITGSYDEGEWVADVLTQQYPVTVLGEVAPLVRDQAGHSRNGIRRGRVERLAEGGTAILAGPLEALSRGHNVLNSEKRAAFGAAFFVNRPMPIPDSWQPLVQEQNAVALLNERNPEYYGSALVSSQSLAAASARFYRKALAHMLNLSYSARSYRTVTAEERRGLCWSQLVSMWQVIGRLIRGGVPAEVYFLDAKFAPLTASGRQDSGTHSLLYGILEVLEPYMQGRAEPFECTLAQSLYGAFWESLRRAKGLKPNVPADPSSGLGTD